MTLAFGRTSYVVDRARTVAGSIALLAGLWCSGSAQTAYAATFTVTSNSDGGVGGCTAATSGDGCTLREAIVAASAVPSDDIIRFATSVAGTIQLNGPLPDLTTNLDIRGPGANKLGIRGQRDMAAYSVFRIDNGSRVPELVVSLSGVTIENGDAGAIGSSTGGKGGGIYIRRAKVTLNSCVLRGNAAAEGGALFNESGNLSMYASTVHGNTSGVMIQGTQSARADATLTGCTISYDGLRIHGIGNNSDNYQNAALMQVVNCTIVTRTTGLSAYSTNSRWPIGHSKISGSLLYAEAPGSTLSGSVQSLGGNMTSDHPGQLRDPNNDPRDETDARVLVGALGNHGGPVPTHALLTGSAAIDSGHHELTAPDTLDADNDGNRSEPVPFDQRGKGFNRVIGARVDIGAYEAGAFPSTPITVTLSTDEEDGDLSPGDISLREAMLLANADSNVSVIRFASGVRGTIVLTRALPVIVSDIELQGPAASALTLQRSTAPGTAEFRFFSVQPGRSFVLSGLTLRNGSSSYGGGAIVSSGTVRVFACVLTENRAQYDGGAIYNMGALFLEQSTIHGNTAKSGGGIFNEQEPGTPRTFVHGCTFSGNTADRGGAIIARSFVTLVGSTISGNSASVGGGLHTESGFQTGVQVRDCTITANSAPAGQGGGVYVGGNTVLFRNNIVCGNLGSDIDVPGTSTSSYSQGFNFVGKGNGLTYFGVPGDRRGTDPRLGPLARNGGLTATHALLPDSPCIDAGYAVSRSDQRLFTRPTVVRPNYDSYLSNGSDIGAFELGATSAPRIKIGPWRDLSEATSLLPVNGTATDNNAVARVFFSLRRNADGLFWTGSAWGAQTSLPTVLAGVVIDGDSNWSSVSWSPTGGLPAGADLRAGSYTFIATVVDIDKNQGSTTVTVIVPDTTPPVLTFTLPGSNAALRSLTAISGTVSDDNGDAGVSGVSLTLRRDRDGQFWNGSIWTAETALTTLRGGTAGNITWRRTTALPYGANLANGAYTLTASASDATSNKASVTSHFTIDTQAPTVAISDPVNSSRISSLTQIRGSATDGAGSGAQRVQLTLFRTSDKTYWDGNGWGSVAVELPVEVDEMGGGTVAWSCTALPAGGNLVDGAYRARAIAADRASNLSVPVTSTFTLYRPVASSAIPDYAGTDDSIHVSSVSSVRLSTASASVDGRIRLVFTGALSPTSADAGHYQLTQNGVVLDVSQVARPNVQTVELLTAEGKSSAGGRVSISYELLDAAGRTVKGTVQVSVR